MNDVKALMFPLFAVLLWIGRPQQASAVTPEPTDQNGAKATDPGEAAFAWETPLRFARFMETQSKSDELRIKIAYALTYSENFDEALTFTRKIEAPEDRGRTLSHISSMLVKAGDLERAEEVIQEIIDPIEKHYANSPLIRALIEAGKIEVAIVVTQNIAEPAKQASGYFDIVKALSDTDEFERAHELISLIEDDFYKSRGLQEISKALVEQGKFEQAIEAALQMDSSQAWMKRDKRTQLSWIARSLAKAGQYEQSIALVQQFDDNDHKVRGLVGVALTLHETGQAKEAFTVLKHASDIVPTIDDPFDKRSALNLVTEIQEKFISSTIEQDDLKQAMLLSEISESPYVKSLVRDAVSLDLAMNGSIQEAIEVLRGPNSIRSNDSGPVLRLVQALAEKKHFAQAIAVSEQIDERNLLKVSALVSIANALTESGDKQQAVHILNKALDVNNTIDSQSAKESRLKLLIKGFHLAGETDLALKLAQSIETSELRQQVIGELAWMTVHDGAIDKGLELAESIKIKSIRNSTFNDIVCELSETGHLDEAFEVVQKITQRTERENAIYEVAPLLAQAGQVSRAVELANRIKSKSMKDEALGAIAKILAEAGDLKQALELARKIKDSSHDNDALYELHLKLAEAGQFDDALELALRLNEDSYYLDGVLMGISEQLISRGNTKRAIEVMGMIKKFDQRNEWGRWELTEKIMTAMLNAKDIEGAVAYTVTSNADYSEMYARIHVARKLFELRQLQSGLDTMRQAIKAALEIEKADKRQQALKFIAQSLVEAELFEPALELARRIPKMKDRVDALSCFVPSLAFELPPKNERVDHFVANNSKLKQAFSPEEQQLAKQVVEIVLGN